MSLTQHGLGAALAAFTLGHVIRRLRSWARSGVRDGAATPLTAMVLFAAACSAQPGFPFDEGSAGSGDGPASSGGSSSPTNTGGATSSGAMTTGAAGSSSATGGTGGGAAGSGGGSTGAGGVGGGAGATCVPVGGAPPPGSCAALGIVLKPPYSQSYSCFDLGPIPGVPEDWGGIVASHGDPYTLLVGGTANTAAGALYSVSIDRSSGCHVLGFTGASQLVAEAAYNDGGISYGPGNVLFLARWPVNELGFQKLGSVATDKIVPLGEFGVAPSIAGLGFVPPGFPNQGALKLLSWEGGEWYDAAIAPDVNGTFDVLSTNYRVTLPGGPENFVYIAAGNPAFPVNSTLVSEWTAGNIAAYEIDAADDPIVGTRVDFVTGLLGAEGAYLDPWSGDFLFTTFGGVHRVIAIRGFKVPAHQ